MLENFYLVVMIVGFGYVLFSVVVQGLTLRPFLKRLRLTSHTEKETEFERLLAQMSTAQASVTALRELYNEHLISKPLADRLQKRYEDWMQKHQVHINQMISEKPQLAETNIKLVQREIANTQKQTLRLLLRRGIISEEVYNEFNDRIDERIEKQANGDLSIPADLMEGLEDFLPSDLSTRE